jgi:hypothetical protein
MKLFSERKGITKPRTELQIESMDDALKNCLWNVLSGNYFEIEHRLDGRPTETMGAFLLLVWHRYFKEPTDTIRTYWSQNYAYIREYFFQAPWYAVYDFIEFTVKNYPDGQLNDKAIKAFN